MQNLFLTGKRYIASGYNKYNGLSGKHRNLVLIRKLYYLVLFILLVVIQLIMLKMYLIINTFHVECHILFLFTKQQYLLSRKMRGLIWSKIIYEERKVKCTYILVNGCYLALLGAGQFGSIHIS